MKNNATKKMPVWLLVVALLAVGCAATPQKPTPDVVPDQKTGIVVGQDASRMLLSAAARGDAVGIAAALAGGANANTKDARNIPALVIAVNSGKADAVNALLTAGAGGINDSYDLGKVKSRPLALAAWNGYHEVAAVLLASGADLKADGGDAWRGAIVFASLPTVQVFLTAGADPNFRFADGESAVTIASLRGNVDVLRVLLDNKGNGNFRNNRGVTAIMYAAAHGSPFSAGVKI
jgi:ankyrin repeat protein